MEVFSISGARFGATASCPAGWVVTPNGNCGSGAAKYRHPNAVKLQESLNRAGIQVAVDGVVGPRTAEAVNTALGTNLSIHQVAEQAVTLSVRLLEKAVATGAKPVPAAPITQPEPGVQPGPPQPVTARRGYPTGGVVALIGLGLISAGVGAYFTWEG